MDLIKIYKLIKNKKYVSGLSHSFLFPQHKSINVQIDSLEPSLQIKVLELSFEQLNIRMRGSLACTVFFNS